MIQNTRDFVYKNVRGLRGKSSDFIDNVLVTSMRFQVLKAASMNITFWVIAPYSLVEVDRRFRYSYCLYLQGDI
jgi:hypothetical protein